MNRIKKLLRKWLEISEDYEHLMAHIHTDKHAIDKLEKMMEDRSVIHCDIDMMSNRHQIIAVGTLKGRDYVQAYVVDADSFVNLVKQLNRITDGNISKFGRIDSPVYFDVSFCKQSGRISE